jgi:hypothetical protein
MASDTGMSNKRNFCSFYFGFAFRLVKVVARRLYCVKVSECVFLFFKFMRERPGKI